MSLADNLISIILIVDDINIPTPLTIYADDKMKVRQYSEDELQDMLDNGEIPKLRRIKDFDNLVRMFHMVEETENFTYEFTAKQTEILTKCFKTYQDDTIDRKLEVPDLLNFVQHCDDCTIPFQRKNSSEAYKNFAKYNNLRLAPEDHLAIIRKFECSDYVGCVRSHYTDFWGNKIFRFLRNDEFFNSVNESIGRHNLWMEINVRQSYAGDTLALISLHDAETI